MSAQDIIRELLAGKGGAEYWRSLDELVGTPAVTEFLEQEFPHLASAWETAISRRSALKLLGASLALAGLGGCGDVKPLEAIVPYVDSPDVLTLGKPLHYATTLTLGGYGRGVVVDTREGRPIKIEGNPRHPASLGATDLFAQAEVLTLYDPDRSQAVMRNNRISTWQRFLAMLSEYPLGRGEGVYLLTGTITSPSVGDQIAQFLRAYPSARWHVHEAVDLGNAPEGARLAFGQPLNTLYRFERAKVIVSLDADFLLTMPGHLRYAREFTDRRRVRDGAKAMNRLYALHSAPTITGAMADHHLTLRASEVERAARHLAQRLGLAVTTGEEKPPLAAGWLEAVVEDLEHHRGECMVVVGEHQPPAVHALGLLINHHLGNLGSTVVHTEPVWAEPWQQAGDLEGLVEVMATDRVRALFMLEVNPVYTAPADLNFARHLKKVELSVHTGLYVDETATLCDWHIPALHELEAWGDACAFDGTASLMQPSITPLYQGHSRHEVLAALRGDWGLSNYVLVRGYWLQRHGEKGFERFWRQALYRGVIRDSAPPLKQARLRDDLIAQLPTPSAPVQTLELQFRPDPTLWDGSYANNAWLQELPKPMTQLCWGNAAFISPKTAVALELHKEDEVELEFGGYQLRAPVWIQPNQADDAVTLYLGHGRAQVGHVGQGNGVNAYRLRTFAHPWFGGGLTLRRTGAKAEVVTTQHHHAMHGRHLLKHATLAEYLHNPDLLHDEPHEQPPEHSLYPQFDYGDHYAWGMVVDASACIGCKACTIACQAENNIPVVGKEQVAHGREMHWLRVDVWYRGALTHPHTYFQPVPCMHCEKAPCEYVCPVEATLHTSEGLNAMVYNRCVGTRFCSQNCPYKVRRFNFLEWTSTDLSAPPPVQNPEVTVRSRGVMEKCTYCVQRISRARIEAKKANRHIQEGEVMTACQQVCPTQAIVFGDLNNREAQVRRYRDHPLNYLLLAELNTRPRTSYLAHLRHPNPQLKEA